MAQELSRLLPGRTLDSTTVKTKSIQNSGALIRANDTGRYLFLLRNGAKFDGTWGMPGGKINPNESTIACLRREIHEEIGLDVTNLKTIPLETYTSVDKYFIYHTFLVIVDNEFIPVLNNEHRAWAWCNISDVPRPLHPGLFKTFQIDEVVNKIRVAESVYNLN